MLFNSLDIRFLISVPQIFRQMKNLSLFIFVSPHSQVNVIWEKEIKQKNFYLYTLSVMIGINTPEDFFHPHFVSSLLKPIHCMTCKYTLNEWYLAAESVGGSFSGCIPFFDVAAIVKYFCFLSVPRESLNLAPTKRKSNPKKCNRWPNIEIFWVSLPSSIKLILLLISFSLFKFMCTLYYYLLCIYTTFLPILFYTYFSCL